MDSNSIGKFPYGYIYISFFPPTMNHPAERFYIGQRKFGKRNGFIFNQNYHGSGRAVYDYIKASPNTAIRTTCLVYAYSQEELNRLENYWISFKIKGKEYPDSFNLRSGGMQSGCSEETQKRMSQIKKGKTNTPEQKIKISRSLKGRPKTEAHKIAAGLARRGIKHSEESKQLMRQKHLEYLNKSGVREYLKLVSKRRKDVICLDTLKTYISSMEASRQIKTTSDGAILMCCKRLRKQAGGYRWMFLDEYLIQNQQSSVLYENFFEFLR
jgi:hypothetical protein